MGGVQGGRGEAAGRTACPRRHGMAHRPGQAERVLCGAAPHTLGANADSASRTAASTRPCSASSRSPCTAGPGSTPHLSCTARVPRPAAAHRAPWRQQAAEHSVSHHSAARRSAVQHSAAYLHHLAAKAVHQQLAGHLGRDAARPVGSSGSRGQERSVMGGVRGEGAPALRQANHRVLCCCAAAGGRGRSVVGTKCPGRLQRT